MRRCGLFRLRSQRCTCLPGSPRLDWLTPSLTPLAAPGLAVLMFLASLFHIRRKEYQALAITLPLDALCVFVAYGRCQLMPL